MPMPNWEDFDADGDGTLSGEELRAYQAAYWSASFSEIPTDSTLSDSTDTTSGGLNWTAAMHSDARVTDPYMASHGDPNIVPAIIEALAAGSITETEAIQGILGGGYESFLQATPEQQATLFTTLEFTQDNIDNFSTQTTTVDAEAQVDTDNAQLGDYVDVINDNLDIPDEFDAEFNAWLSGQLLGESTQMSPELVGVFTSIPDSQATLHNSISELGDWQEFDITSLPADSTETNGVAEVLETGTDSTAAQNAIAQTIADQILSGDIHSQIYRPEDTGDPVVDDFIQQIFGDTWITSGAGILDRNDVFSDWLQTNNPEDYQTISDINDNRQVATTSETTDVDVTTTTDVDVTTIDNGRPQNPTEGQTHVADGINWIYTNGNWQVNTTSTDTNGDTVMWPENPTEGQTHTADGRSWIYTNGDWVLNVPEGGGVFQSGQTVTMGDGSVYSVDMGPDGNLIYTVVNDLPEGHVTDWDFSSGIVEGEHEWASSLENIIYSLLGGLFGGGGGSMSQDQANVLQNVLQDLVDVSVSQGDTTATSDVDIGPTTATSDVDIGPTTLTTGPSTADVDIGPTTLTTGPSTADATIEEGAVSNVISDLFEEGAVTATGGAGGTGGTSTIEAGAISNAPVFTDAVNLEDMFQEGAITGGAGGTSTIESGAVTSAGGAGGAGGTGGTGGSIEAGAISNAPVFTDAVDLSDMISAPLIGEGAINIDTAGLGTAVDSFGNVIGGFGENLMDFLGTFVGGQNQQSENSLAGILADAAARKYAAEAFEDASANELAFQKAIYDAGIEYQEPFYDLGVTAAKEVMPDYVEASKRDVVYDDFDPFDAEDPALRFLQDEQRRALESSSAARGRLNSGGTLTDLQDRAANIALTRAGEVGNIMQQMNQEARLRDEYDLAKLDDLISRSQRSADVMSGQGAGYATQGGRILENLGGFQADNSANQSDYYRNILRDLFGI